MQPQQKPVRRLAPFAITIDRIQNMNSTPLDLRDASAVVPVLESLYVAVVCDVLDGLGFHHQALRHDIRPLTPSRKLAGRIFPARAERVSQVPAEPYKLEIAAVEAMTSGEVLVVDAGDERACGFWGELLTTACIHKGVRGVVMTACTRDLWKIKELEFPVFGIGHHPADSKGRADIVEIGRPIVIGGAKAKRGDWLLGDEDGVVVIPSEVAEETLRLAREKASGENIVRQELARGMPMGEAFRKYGIL
jgi:4-hydroxy-4-methyl-2-oxoglutarate aldolase